MTADDFREIALSMQDASEGAHMGHPDFRVNGRIFATLHADDQTGTVMTTPEEQQELIKQHPKIFVPAAGAWGRGGSTYVHLPAASTSVVRGAILLAWQRISAKPPSRKRR
jgi:hypothetical protein